MPTLRIQQVGENVVATFEADGQPSQSVTRPLTLALSAQDEEDIRWYLEDYLIYPLEPAPTIAARIEKRMEEIGRELFRSTLGGTKVWFSAEQQLEDTRVVIESDVRHTRVPWELLRDPETEISLALHVPSFVRAHSSSSFAPKPGDGSGPKIRMMLAICRPGGAEDVPFRSVARHLLKRLGAEAHEHFDIDMLRPPTFAELARRLRAAKAERRPFHLLHFDGHGTSGAVLFENLDLEGNRELVSAEKLGKLLKETGVPLLVLNACRSGQARDRREPPPESPVGAQDEHGEIREFGSLAHSVVDYGAGGVVAWRYNVFVDTAAQFMADLYAALVSGQELGVAGTMARKQLSNSPRPIEDWTVPVIYEAAPMALFPRRDTAIEIRLETQTAKQSGLPEAPDIGFIGRDETILRLERAFDTEPIVLLHAYAGSGKTSTATEFAHWYRQTGGIDGPVLFTTFERKKTLAEVLGQLGQVFEGVLAKNNIQWLTLDDDQRRSVAMQLLQQVPVFWIWDNVEPIAGFPAGSKSEWSAEEQKELADFLRGARGAKAKFLLTSRRDERGWLQDLPARLELPPMAFEDQMQMTAALASKQGRQLQDVEDWRPLLEFTQGNPLTLLVLVGQALRGGLRSRRQIQDFVGKLRTGEAKFHDEASEGRRRSLAASLAYGFENAFTEAERKQLALLHLFQGFVDVDALRAMGSSDADWCLPEVKDLTREAGIALLDRAAEIGLLTALGSGYYSIHPALPWFLKQLFEQYYEDRGTAAMRAFVAAVSGWSNYYFDEYQEGKGEVTGILGLEEANLLQARALARTHCWWTDVIRGMQGLYALYWRTGRHTEWARLVEEIAPHLIDPSSGGPLAGLEEEWSIVLGHRVELARVARRFSDAEAWQKTRIDRRRSMAAAALSRPTENWAPKERFAIRQLAISLQELGLNQYLRGLAVCVETYEEALELGERCGAVSVAAGCALNLGTAYKDLPEIRDLTAAERWYEASLRLTYEGDRIGRARCYGQLGHVARERYREAQQAKAPREECTAHLEASAGLYHQALELLPQNDFADLAIVFDSLGYVYKEADQLDTALHYYRNSIRCEEAQGNRFGAGETRYNVGLALARAERPSEALEWARAALRDFEGSENADEMIGKTVQLIRLIQAQLQKNAAAGE